MHLIPDFRLNKQVVRADIAFLKTLGDVEFKHGVIVIPNENGRADLPVGQIARPRGHAKHKIMLESLRENFDAVVRVRPRPEANRSG